MGQSGRVGELQLVRTGRKLGHLGSGLWGSSFASYPRILSPSKPKSCDTCDSFPIDRLLKEGGPKTLQTSIPKAKKPPCGTTPAKPVTAGKAGPAVICAAKAEAASGPPRPLRAPPHTGPSRLPGKPGERSRLSGNTAHAQQPDLVQVARRKVFLDSQSRTPAPELRVAGGESWPSVAAPASLA